MNFVLKRSRSPPESKRATAARRKLRTHQPQPSPDLFLWAGVAAPNAAPRIDPAQVIKWAMGIWYSGIDARHAILAEKYFAGPPPIGGEVLRFHQSLRFGDRRAPGLIWLLRSVLNDEPVGIIRHFLDDSGALIGSRVLGQLFNSAIKLDPDENVEDGLHIIGGLNISSALDAMSQGLRPLWVVNDLSAFPVLSGIETLTIVSGDDNAVAVAAVAARFRADGREVIVLPKAEPPRDVEPRSGSP